MPQNKLDIIATQSRFYQSNFRKLLTFNFMLVGLAYILLGVIFYLHFSRPTPKYFVATSDGRLIEILSTREIQNQANNPSASSTNNATTPTQ